MEDAFKWGDFYDWDDGEHDENGKFEKYIEDQVDDVLCWDDYAQGYSAFESRYEKDSRFSLMQVYWDTRKGCAVVDLHQDFLDTYDILRKDALIDAENQLRHLYNALRSDERNNRVDALRKDKTRPKALRSYEACEQEIDKQVCADFHIDCNESDGRCDHLRNKWCNHIQEMEDRVFKEGFANMRIMHDEYFNYVQSQL